MTSETIKIGEFYQHFKGGIYQVICLAKHSETLEDTVVYGNENGEIYTRPLSMFVELIERDGKTFQRFKLLNKNEIQHGKYDRGVETAKGSNGDGFYPFMLRMFKQI